MLAPTVSPKKSVEGLAGGIALAVAAALLARTWILPEFSLLDALAIVVEDGIDDGGFAGCGIGDEVCGGEARLVEEADDVRQTGDRRQRVGTHAPKAAAAKAKKAAKEAKQKAPAKKKASKKPSAK